MRLREFECSERPRGEVERGGKKRERKKKKIEGLGTS